MPHRAPPSAAAPAAPRAAPIRPLLLRPLPEAFRTDAAALHLEAFGGKIGRVLGRGDRARAFLADCLAPDHALAAISPDGARLLGVAGLRLQGGGFVNGGWAEMTAHYGALGGAWRGLALAALERESVPGALTLEGICVARGMRGRGIGTAMLRAVEAEARAHGLAAIRLEVSERNSRAAALYARCGYRVSGRIPMGLAGRLYGVRASVVMTRDLPDHG